ncbi:MAG: AEC family transporter [Chloroflexi bacterium]|nr:MAG: AEC family transporter [Chloroflexota bacterium]
MLIRAFIDVLLPIVVVVLVGYVLKRFLPVDTRSLNRMSMYVLSPALIFITIIKIQIPGTEVLRISLTSVAVCLGSGLIAYAIARLRKTDAPSMAALLLTTMFMNSGNYGLPTANFAFGQAGLDRALLYFIAQAIMAQTLTIAIAQAGNSNWRTGFKQILKMPPIYAVCVALVLRWLGVSFDTPNVLGSLLHGIDLISQATLPLLLMLLGMQLAQETVIEDVPLTSIAVIIRLFASPLIAYGVAVALQLDALATNVVVLQASMPTAVNMVLYSLEFNARPKFVAGTVVITTLLSVVTLTILLTVMGV